MDENRFSSFGIIGSRIIHFDFDSSIFSFDEKHFKKQYGRTCEIQSVTTKNQTRYGTIILNIEVHVKNKESSEEHKADVHMSIEGGFLAPDSMGEDDFRSMLMINGAAALYSIARSYLISVTSQSFIHGCITLPLVDFLPDPTQNN